MDRGRGGIRRRAGVCRRDAGYRNRIGLFPVMAPPPAGGNDQHDNCQTPPLTPVSWSEQMAGSIPGARLTLIDDCGHLSTMERPEAVSAALAGWLAA